MKMLPHQKRTGMTSHYINQRLMAMHACERRGSMGLYEWVMRFKPFLTWGKPPTNAEQTYPSEAQGTPGDRVVSAQRPPRRVRR